MKKLDRVSGAIRGRGYSLGDQLRSVLAHFVHHGRWRQVDYSNRRLEQRQETTYR